MSQTNLRDVLSQLLTSSLGEDKALEAVERALKAEGLTAVANRNDATRVLKRIEEQGNVAGLAARLAMSRLDRSLRGSGSLDSDVMPQVQIPDKPRIHQSEISDALARSLGDAKAVESVASAVAALGISKPTLTQDEAVRVFDRIITEGGVVGTVARFAKARFFLARSSA